MTFNRELSLKNQLNTFLTDQLHLPADDYYSHLDADGFLQLKSILGGINNIFTLKLTVSFMHWVSDKFDLPVESREAALAQIMESKPSTNGFDVEVITPIKIIAEVKCNIPINGGSKYGSAQKHGIRKDLQSLALGKSKSSATPGDFFKFMVLLDNPEIRKATEHLIKGMNRGAEHIKFIDDAEVELSPEYIYIVFIAI